jgi:putative NADH-flavin reductase
MREITPTRPIRNRRFQQGRRIASRSRTLVGLFGMRLFVIGATGHTGTQIVDLALGRGHCVTAFVRSPAKIQRRDDGLSVVLGDPLSTDGLAAALPGHDAVLSALGMRPPAAFRPHTLVQDAAASTVAAMTRSGVARIALVSAAVLFPLRGAQYAFFRWMLQHIARDLAAAENILGATTLDWTIARPPRLAQRADDAYRERTGALPEPARAMSFRGVAKFLLDTVEQRTHVHDIVGLAR